MMLPKGIIFDLDDTLISLKGTAQEGWKRVCEVYCDRNGKMDAQVLFDTITGVRLAFWADPDKNERGRKDQKAARREIISQVFEGLGLPDEEAVAVADAFSKTRLDTLKLFPGVHETLKRLKEEGVKLALITNGEAVIQRSKIERFELEQYFDCILIETEVGYGKPDSRVYEQAMETMGVSCQETWSIGDHLVWDVEAPQKLGIYAIWNDFEGVGLPTDSEVVPDRIVKGISELFYAY